MVKRAACNLKPARTRSTATTLAHSLRGANVGPDLSYVCAVATKPLIYPYVFVTAGYIFTTSKY